MFSLMLPVKQPFTNTKEAETMKIKNLRIKQLIKVANLMNRYPALSEAQQEVYQYATNIVYLL